MSNEKTNHEILLSSQFAKTHFSSARYAKKVFSNSTTKGASEAQASLQENLEVAALELKKNVFNNYHQFIDTSKEIQKMEGEILELRNLMINLGDNLKVLHGTDDFVSSTTRDRTSQITNNKPLSGSTLTPKQSQKLQHLLTLPDQLDIFISERRFKEAVSLILEKGGEVKGDLESYGKTLGLNKELRVRVSRLVELLSQFLQNPTIEKSEARQTISLLISLGLPEQARDLFLASREHFIQQEIRKLSFEGDIVSYITDLTTLVFSSIATTCEDFRYSFRCSKMFSGFIVWSIEQIKVYYGKFNKQVFLSDDCDFYTMARCLEISSKNCKMLEKKGISLSFYLNDLLQGGTVTGVKAYGKRICDGLQTQLKTDNFNIRDQWIYLATSSTYSTASRRYRDSASLRLTDSGKFFYSSIQRFVNFVSLFVNMPLFETVQETTLTVFKFFFDECAHLFCSHEINDKQIMGIFCNINKTVEHLLPKMSSTFLHNCHKKGSLPRGAVKEFLEVISQNVKNWMEMAREEFCKHRAFIIVDKKLNWHQVDYADIVQATQLKEPTIKFQRLISYLSVLKNMISSDVSSSYMLPLISSILHHIAFFIYTGEDDIKFGSRDEVKQFVIDMKYLKVASGPFLAKETASLLDKIINSKLKVFCATFNYESSDILKEGDRWFEGAVAKPKHTLKSKSRHKSVLEGKNTTTSTRHTCPKSSNHK